MLDQNGLLPVQELPARAHTCPWGVWGLTRTYPDLVLAFPDLCHGPIPDPSDPFGPISQGRVRDMSWECPEL